MKLSVSQKIPTNAKLLRQCKYCNETRIKLISDISFVYIPGKKILTLSKEVLKLYEYSLKFCVSYKLSHVILVNSLLVPVFETLSCLQLNYPHLNKEIYLISTLFLKQYCVMFMLCDLVLTINHSELLF